MAPPPREKLSSSSKDIPTTTLPAAHKLAIYLPLFIFLSLSLHILFIYLPPTTTTVTTSGSLLQPSTPTDRAIARFFIYPLPDHFNSALLRRCSSLNIYTNMCPHVAHRGLGRPIPPPPTTTSSSSNWYATNQFLAEMIFHARAELHPCRTLDPFAAELFYIPFYAGLYASSQFPQPNHTLRDSLALQLAAHLSTQPFFRRHHGSDHFLVLGRTAWDFMRPDPHPAAPDFGANRLLLLPELANVTALTVERHPWQGHNQHGIPYASYFHPTSAAELATWQDMVRNSKRTHLFSFVGGSRPPTLKKAAVRAEILRQCGSSTRCLRTQCEPGSKDCHDPDRVINVMLRAEFCMQPPGDSFTRRSTFDSILAGCVPVFFSEHTAYTQYHWYTPARHDDWSVLLPPDKWGQIEDELARIPRDDVDRMRETVIQMIPRVTYAHPNSSLSGDAVDVALIELTDLVRSRRRDMQ